MGFTWFVDTMFWGEGVGLTLVFSPKKRTDHTRDLDHRLACCLGLVGSVPSAGSCYLRPEPHLLSPGRSLKEEVHPLRS